MRADIEHLAKLQAVELERSRLVQSVKTLPAEIKNAEAAVAAAQQKSAAASDALTREESLRTRLEREIAGHKQKAARFKAQQDSVTTSAQAAAIEHEVGFAQSEIDRLENEEFASLERTETQEATLAAARGQVQEMAEALEKTRAWAAQKQQEIAQEQAALLTEREVLRQAIEPDLLARFDRIAASRGTGLALAENQQCTGCRMGIRPQTESATGDGHAIRRPRQAGA